MSRSGAGPAHLLAERGGVDERASPSWSPPRGARPRPLPAVARAAPLPAAARFLPRPRARPARAAAAAPAGPSGEMNTVLSRANSLFAFSLSVMAALTFGCFITTAFKERSVPVRIAVSRVTLKNVEDFTGPRERSDLGFVTFDITADLQSIFDWNVKQLFLYLSAEYSTKNNALNQVVLWDKIMLRGDNPRLSLKDMKSKYFFFDDGNGLKGNRNITLTLSWNVVPNAGILPLVTGSGHVSVPFPDTYETTKSY
uniref:Signal peptidase complex subunit 3 n=1 Tax=Zonotrichia albicollis TaxID=44394 RepID=A0A8D2MVD0_ZONAL